MRRWGVLVSAALLLSPLKSAAWGQEVPPLPFLNGASSTDALAGNLRGYLIEHIPAVLLEDNRHWGQQKLVTRGLEWKGKGKVLPQAQKSYKNHGVWRRIKVTASNLRDTLVFDLRDVQRAGPDRLTFTAFVAFDAHAEYDQQNWRSGVRTYAGSVRARLRVKAALYCEMTTRLDRTDKLIPDVIFRGHVLRADLRFDNIVVEHVNGVGGDLAKLIGNAAQDVLHKWRPSLERKLLEKGNAAIVKAGDTKEVRISLTKLFEKKEE
ncbi:MAG: hypothetical protein HYS12_17975 [Planctomycetes bacterium]|nr:hypothetical protein [Planctomycetota bacterium]